MKGEGPRNATKSHALSFEWRNQDNAESVLLRAPMAVPLYPNASSEKSVLQVKS